MSELASSGGCGKVSPADSVEDGLHARARGWGRPGKPHYHLYAHHYLARCSCHQTAPSSPAWLVGCSAAVSTALGSFASKVADTLKHRQTYQATSIARNAYRGLPARHSTALGSGRKLWKVCPAKQLHPMPISQPCSALLNGTPPVGEDTLSKLR